VSVACDPRLGSSNCGFLVRGPRPRTKKALGRDRTWGERCPAVRGRGELSTWAAPTSVALERGVSAAGAKAGRSAAEPRPVALERGVGVGCRRGAKRLPGVRSGRSRTRGGRWRAAKSPERGECGPRRAAKRGGCCRAAKPPERGCGRRRAAKRGGRWRAAKPPERGVCGRRRRPGCAKLPRSDVGRALPGGEAAGARRSRARSRSYARACEVVAVELPGGAAAGARLEAAGARRDWAAKLPERGATGRRSRRSATPPRSASERSGAKPRSKPRPDAEKARRSRA